MKNLYISLLICLIQTHCTTASDKLISYVLCHTKSPKTNIYRQQLKIHCNDATWSASLQENSVSFFNKKETLLDEIHGRYLIILARAIHSGEDIIKDHTVIQRRLSAKSSESINLKVSDNITDTSRTASFTVALNLHIQPNLCERQL